MVRVDLKSGIAMDAAATAAAILAAAGVAAAAATAAAAVLDYSLHSRMLQ